MIVIVKIWDNDKTIYLHFKKLDSSSKQEKNPYRLDKITFPYDTNNSNSIIIPETTTKTISFSSDPKKDRQLFFSQKDTIQVSSITSLNRKKRDEIDDIILHLNIEKIAITVEYNALDQAKHYSCDLAHSPLFWVGLLLVSTASVSWCALAGMGLIAPQAAMLVFMAAIIIGGLFITASIVRNTTLFNRLCHTIGYGGDRHSTRPK